MAEADPKPKGHASEPGSEPAFRVEDKRHWARPPTDEAEGDGSNDTLSTVPTVVGEYRARAEAAEKKLLEYIAAYRESQAEQERFRERLSKDVERRVALHFGALVADLLECLDDLDLALAHAAEVREVTGLATGVALARDRFLASLQRQGVERLVLDGDGFDPNLAEAVRVDPVDDPEQNGKVTQTLRPGYRMGDRLLRPARVAVGRHGG